jgi:ABC-2 type transport system permease protein
MPAIIKTFNENSKNKTEQSEASGSNAKESKGIVIILDSKNVLNGNLEAIKTVYPNYDFKVESNGNVEELKTKVKEEENTALLILDNKNGVPTFDYFVKQYGDGIDPTAISKILKSIFTTDLLKASNVSDSVSALVQSDVSYNVQELGKGKMKSYISSIVISMLLFFSIYYYGYGVAMSVASEKTSRVMELLVTSVKPSKIILGKSAAMGLLGLCQMFLVVVTGVGTYKLTSPDNFTIGGQALDFSNFTPFGLSMIIVYFILGYSLYAMMNAVAGASVSKAEDVNSSIMPISMISMVSFYLGYFTLAIPEGTIAIVASIIPFSAPFSMPCRLLATEVPAWQIMASIASLIVTIILIAWMSIKIYSSAVLHYGKRLKMKDLLQMSKHK